MKKVLVGGSVLCFVLILVGAILSAADDRKMASCDNIAILPPANEFNEIDTQKSYALHFPVR